MVSTHSLMHRHRKPKLNSRNLKASGQETLGKLISIVTSSYLNTQSLILLYGIFDFCTFSPDRASSSHPMATVTCVWQKV